MRQSRALHHRPHLTSVLTAPNALHFKLHQTGTQEALGMRLNHSRQQGRFNGFCAEPMPHLDSEMRLGAGELAQGVKRLPRNKQKDLSSDPPKPFCKTHVSNHLWELRSL